MPSFFNGDPGDHLVGVTPHVADSTEPMAIIGLAMRAADEATDAEAFWHFLLRARQATRPIPEDRLSSKAFYHPDPNHGGTFYAEGACFLAESPNGFDAAFFKMSKTEVQSLDPQHRILMENVYHALENAGLPMENVISSNTSVFVNGFNYHHADRLNSDLELSFKHKPTGAESSMVSGRVSWFYNLKGASLTIDTACSSSLVALHLAKQSLAAKESEMAIVSGVSVIGYPTHLMKMSYSGLLGAEGKSMAFDHRANGYGLGEGVGTIILKPLSSAVRDGDTIRAVVRGTGLNHDGHTPGMTYPSATAQESLIRTTYKASGLNPRDTTYVESHGTGTQAGDFIECSAIAAAFETQQRQSPFYVGAVKPNIGHLEGGAGIASVIKSVLMLESGVISPNATLKEVNPKISRAWNLQFPTNCIPWPNCGVRRSSIGAYGISGTNAHCILDDAYHYLNQRGISARHSTREMVPSKNDIEILLAQISKCYETGRTSSGSVVPLINRQSSVINGIHSTNGIHDTNGIHGTNGSATSLPVFDLPIIFIFSAFDEKRLEKVVAGIRNHVSSWILDSASARQSLNDLAFSLSERRSRLPWKIYASCNSVKELQDKLSNLPSKAIKSRSALRIGFVFTGQGAQYAKMGQQLLVYPVFRQSLEAADLYFKSLGSAWSLLEELSRDVKDSKISKSMFAHPLSCAVQIALLDLLLSWNIIPHRVVGHSSGEIAAAYCAGKISREAAWKVAYFRGYVLRPREMKIPFTGGMIAVGLEEEPLLHLLKKLRTRFPSGALSIACYNSPRNHTVSGDIEMVDALKEMLDEQDIFNRKLKVEHAAHSSHMEYFGEEYDARLGELPSKRLLSFNQTVQMFSTLTGRLLDNSCVPGKASHWRDSMVCPVRFTEALSSMCFDSTPEDGSSTSDTQVDVILEVGPHPAMQSAAKETIGANFDIAYLATLNRKDNGFSTLLGTVGSLAIHGAPVNLDKVNRAASPSIEPKLIVDLPSYPFNHDEQGLYESRLIKNTRLRQFPRHDLFGAPVSDWNPNCPRWRHFLRISENPWLKEHVIGDNFVFPGSGYVVMAVEAMQQLANDSDIIGVHLRDIVFKAMLVVPDDTQGVEVCLSFYPVPENKTSLSTVWRRFEVASYNQETEEWVEHCTGEVSTHSKRTVNPIDGSRQEELDRTKWSAFIHSREGICQSPVDLIPIYKYLREVGINHGDSFRCLSNVSVSNEKEGLMTGDIAIQDAMQLMPKQYAHQHLIHPTTLDNIFQAAFAAIYDLKGKEAFRRGCVPSSVREVWLSTTELSSERGTTLRCTSQGSPGTHGSFEIAAHAWDPSNPSTKALSVSGARLSPFKPEGSDAPANDRRTCYSIEWLPDLNYLTNEDLQKNLLPVSKIPPESYFTQLEWLSKFQLASALLAYDSLLAIRGVKIPDIGNQHASSLEFLQDIVANLTIDAVPYVSFEKWWKYSRNLVLKQQLYNEVEAQNPEGALLIRMGSMISSILQRRTTTEKLQFEMEELFWARDMSNLSRGNILPTLTQYLTLLCRSNRSLRVLDVQGGTGALSEHVLKVFCGDNNADFIDEYVICSLSADCLGPLKKRLNAWGEAIKYKTLDLSVDPTEQGFETESFDLIIIDNYVHAMPNMEETLSRLNTLAKPGCQLCVLEPTRPESIHSNASFSLFHVWWQALKMFPKVGAFAQKSEWDKALRSTGFSGINIEASNSAYAEFSDFTLMVSTANHRPLEAVVPSLEVLVIIRSHSALSGLLAERLNHAGLKHSVCQLDMLRPGDLSGRACISLLEAKEPILNSMDNRTFQEIQQLVTSSDLLLWVTGDPLVQPEFQMATGLLRTARWELDRNNLNLVTLSLDGGEMATVDDNVDAVFQVFERQFLRHGGDPGGSNVEYRVRRRMIETNKIIKNKAASTAIEAQFEKPKAIVSRWDEIERPVRLASLQPGFDYLTWTTDEDLSSKPLTDHEIEVDVRAVGLNFKDVLVAMGEIDQSGFGHEAAGIVVAVGSSVSGFKSGDRVMCLGDPSPGRMGTLRSRCRVHSGLAIKIPDALNFEIAAGLPIIYGTVIYSLGHIARLKAGEKILIHAAAGGIGQAAIQYAQVKRAEIFVTLSSIEKKQSIMDNFNIPADHIFSSRDLTFSRGIKHIAPAGVDVVLNSLSGEALRQSWACIAPFGRFVEIGKLDFQAGSNLEMTPFQHNVTFSGVDLNALAEHRPEICQSIFQEMMQLWLSGKIHEARPTRIFDYGQLKDGIRLLQTGKSIGKMTLVPGSHPVPVLPAPLPPLKMDPHATYILAGGLGGIGRSIAIELAKMGAKSLIFLSRSAVVHEAGQNTIAKLESLGCTSKVFQCDISDTARLQEVFSKIHETLPPVKGCIQCCFVLKDGAFESMSHQDWQAALSPKVSGSWNLHKLLPDVDFFLMLSSITGIVGNRSQANYNAGNNFQDSLARHRVSKGMHGASVNLGAVVGIGFIAENSEYAGKHTFKIANQQTEKEVLAVVKYMIDRRHHITMSPDSAQLVCGLRTPPSYSRGNEEHPAHLKYPMFSQLPPALPNASSAIGAGGGKPATLVRDHLQTAETQNDVAQIICKAIRHKMATLLNVEEDSFDDTLNIRENGVDSLIEMEFRSWVAKELGTTLPLRDLDKDLKHLSAKVALLSKPAMATTSS